MRHAWVALLFVLSVSKTLAETTLFPAKGGGRQELVIYSTLDSQHASLMIEAFQDSNPDVSIRYEDMLASEIAGRVIAETDAGQPTADFIFSSAQDLQLKLANDGYGQISQIAEAKYWPTWAKWQDTAFALTYEPAVLVYHKPSFPDGPPQSRLELLDWLRNVPASLTGRIGTYDVERSAVGFLFLARDAEHFPDIWSLLRAMGRAGLTTYPTSQDIIDRVVDGRLILGYNILGSYAAEKARLAPDLGLVLLRDYTVVASRVAMVPRAAASPKLGGAFLGFLMSDAGQTLLSDKLSLPSVSAGVREDGGGLAMWSAFGGQLRPIPVSPGLLVYLDQAKRQSLLRLWRQSLAGE
jgi:iron(III) transport system substrate-binding protein